MSLQACADIVSKGDPDRFRAAMAAPVEARRILFPLYAFNVEVARAPWVASEPMIGEMRLQWWRDALEEISGGVPVRKHEVTTPLSEVLDPAASELLDAGVAARRWDLYRDPFEDEAHFANYLAATGGNLMWVAARALGAPEDMAQTVTQYGATAALARFFLAVPELEARGRIPLIDGTPEGVAAKAQAALDDLPDLRAVAKDVRPALLEGWQTRKLLERAAKNPGRVADGTLGLGAFQRAWGLFRASL